MARPLTPEGFEELYRSTAPSLYGYLRRQTILDCEDLVAEVYATAWRRRTDLPAAGLRRAWLFGVARNLVLAEQRRWGREQLAAELAARLPGPEGATLDDDLAADVAAALERLRPDDRELVQLVEWEGLSPAEVAIVLGVRPGTVRVRLHRARRLLASDPDLRAAVEARGRPVDAVEHHGPGSPG